LLFPFSFTKLWCLGKLANCPKTSAQRFHFCCLYCRWRREFYGKWSDPSEWIKYTYMSIAPTTQLMSSWQHDGIEYYAPQGKKLRITTYKHIWIDPRGHFTALRCATIIIMDRMMKMWNNLVHTTKPFAELCELLASYPTW